MGSALPENFIQKMEERMKNPEGALISIRSKDIDPSKANPALMELLRKAREERPIRSIIKDFGVDILKQGHKRTSEDEGEF